MRRETSIRHPRPDWLDEFKTEPGEERASKPAPAPDPAPEPDAETLTVIEMPVEDDWFAYFSEDEPEPRGGSLLHSAANQRMWPAVAPLLPPPDEIRRPPSTWDELQEFAKSARPDWPRGSRTAIALAALAVAGFAVVIALWFMQNGRSTEPDSTVAQAPVAPPVGSDLGQTGVRPGSDTGQTWVKPGSDTPQLTPKPTPTPTPPAARATPTPSSKPVPTTSQKPVQATSQKPIQAPAPAPTPPAPTPAAPPPLASGVSTGSSNQVLTTGSTTSTLPPAPAKPPPPGPAFTPPPSPRVLSVPPATGDAPLPSAPPDATAAAKTAITALLEGYRTGHSSLNARAVRAVWPGVNEPALARAFDQLEAQSMSYNSCGIEVKGLFAQAFCVGEVSFVPKVGSRTPRVEVRRWTFDLRRVNDAWVIDRVATR